MPWKETDAMDQRMKFIADVLRKEESFAAVCRRYGVSRATGYKWMERFFEVGPQFADQSRAPRFHPNSTPPAVVDLLLKERKAHPTWGPRKLLVVLARRLPGLELPAASTAGEILRRHGLTVPRRRSRGGASPPSHLGSQVLPNQTWATDLKGQFRTGDGRYCYPLTLEDGASRFLLRIQGLLRPTAENIKPILEAAFREFGLPTAMRSDNGPPFAASGFTGLTRLSAWWVQLGIRLDRTAPASPQQNGRLERLHRTLQEDECRHPRANVDAQQTAFLKWRRVYNEQRPHEALDMRTPSDAYIPSDKPYPERLPSPEYGEGQKTRRVHHNGQVSFGGWNVSITKVLQGHDIAFREVAEGVWEITFYNHLLGTFDIRTGRLSNGSVDRQCDAASNGPKRPRQGDSPSSWRHRAADEAPYGR
jgi:putative transposase